MSLDVFTNYQRDALDYARTHPAESLPLEFGEAFGVSYREGLLFGQSVASSQARMEGVQEFLDGIRAKTGAVLTNPALLGTADALDDLNRQIAALQPQFPNLGLKPLTAEDLDRLGEEKARRARQDYKRAAAREQTFGGAAGLMLGSLAAGVTDPVNLVTVPLAAPASLGILGTALVTAGITATTQAAIEVVGAPYKERVEPGYAASGEAAQNILMAGAAGGVLGGGVKGLAAVWTRYRTGSWPRHVRDAGNVVASEGQIAETNVFPSVEGEVAHRTAMQQAIDALVSGRPVDVGDAITPDLLRAYGARLEPVLDARARAVAAEESAFALEREAARLPPSMERLSEVQLAEIRTAARALDREAQDARARLAAESESLTARRAAIEGRGPERDALRAEVESLRADLATAEERIAAARPATDPQTQARLDAIEADLAGENLTAVRRSALEAERASIAETLATTAPTDARALARTEVEAKGLRIALRRKEKALERAETTDARSRAALDKADAALPRRSAAGEQRALGRRETITTEMRRAVARLAQEGYGVRLSREEAEAMAGRILAAGEDDAAAVLRAATEEMVDRAMARRRAAPARGGGLGRPDPVGEQRARAGHWTEQARKRIQALAREVGYEMPREEATIIAAGVARARSDDEALAILDELMLRPRTVAEALPGTRAALRSPAPLPGQSAAASMVQEDVFRQLVAAGMSSKEAAANAAVWAARYETRAVRLGLGPDAALDLFRREGVEIRSASATDAEAAGSPDQMLQSGRDTGGRAAPADLNADVELKPMVLAKLPAIATHAEARAAVRLGQAANSSGDLVEITGNSTRKWFSRNANEKKRSLAPHLVDAFSQSVTYHRSSGFDYAIGLVHLDGRTVAVRFTLAKSEGGSRRLHQIEGVDVAPISVPADGGSAGQQGARGPARTVTVADAVSAFNRMAPGEFPLFQGQAYRGAITLRENRALIELFEARDRSTFQHESAHLWLTELVRDAETSPAVKADLDLTLHWLGVDDATKVGRAEQEKWAQGFEQYLRDGKAPSAGLQRVFDQFRAWLSAIYRAVADLGAPIPDDIRGVMDRLLAAPEREVSAGAPLHGLPVRAEQLAALARELAPGKALIARSAEETEAAVLHNLDQLRASRDVQVPVGERLDDAGQRVAEMRSVDDLMDEADARLAAAAELRACALHLEAAP